MPIAEYLLAHRVPSQPSTGIEVIKDLLLFESSIFLDELEKTDENFGKKVSQELNFNSTSEENENMVTPVPVVSDPVKEAGTELVEDLPLAELILSSHASLLLYSIVAAVNTEPSLVQYSSQCKSIEESLPRSSLWLLVRTLKAFVALQSKVNIAYFESFFS